MDIVVRSADGKTSVTVTVDHLEEGAYRSIRARLARGLSTMRNFEAISDTFQYAARTCRGANPSDLWHHVVYRCYLDLTHRNEQSWKRASGQALEDAFAAVYNPRLHPHGMRMLPLSRSGIARALREIGVEALVGGSKLDIALEGRCAKEKAMWRVFGCAHVKASMAERISDDVPASVAIMSRGYLSIVLTLDVKSFPPPHGPAVNLGELKPGSDKRAYFEEHGSFHGCYSYNLRTPPSVPPTNSGSQIKTLSLSEPQPDVLVSDLKDWWGKVASELCAKNG